MSSMRKPGFQASAITAVAAFASAALLVGCSTDSSENTEKTTEEPTTTVVSEESETSTAANASTGTSTSPSEDNGASQSSPVGDYDGTYRVTPMEIIEYNRDEYERLAREDPEHLQALQEYENSDGPEYAIDLVIEGEKCWLVSSKDGVQEDETAEECVIDYDAGTLTFIKRGEDSARPIEFIDEDRLDMVIEGGGKKQVHPFKKVKD